MEIQEDYVSFETAKLLKEKGFNISCLQWAERTDNGMKKFGGNKVFHEMRGIFKNNKYCIFYPRPTQALVVKWLRIKHNIEISNRPNFTWYDGSICYIGTAKKVTKKDIKVLWSKGYISKTTKPYHYTTPEEAIESAILYTLKNLLK